MEKKLAKIKSVKFGFREYMFGLTLELGGEGWGVGTNYYYNPNYKGVEGTTEGLIRMATGVQKLLEDAKVETIDKLLNIPVECIFEGQMLKEFRVLTEVL